MFSEVREVKQFVGAKFGYGEIIPDGIYAVPTSTSKGNAFMRIEFKNNEFSGKSNFELFWDEKLKISWYDKKKPLFLKESNFSKQFRKLMKCI